MGGEAAAKVPSLAREHGVVTSADVLAPGEMGLLEWIAPALAHLDHFLPNDEQDADGTERVPAYPVDVVDTTGCGDAFSAGFLRGLSLGRSRRDAAALGCAAAALVAQGLGTEAGDYDLAAAEALAPGA